MTERAAKEARRIKMLKVTAETLSTAAQENPNDDELIDAARKAQFAYDRAVQSIEKRKKYPALKAGLKMLNRLMNKFDALEMEDVADAISKAVVMVEDQLKGNNGNEEAPKKSKKNKKGKGNG